MKGERIKFERKLGLRVTRYVQHSHRIILVRIDETKAEYNLIMIGYMNAVITEAKEGTIVVQYHLENRNDRGKRVIEFFEKNKLILTNP